MKRTIEDSWREVSGYLDEVLDLDIDARQPWIEALQAREPAIAAEVSSYLLELAELERGDFLGVAAVSLFTPASLAGQIFGAYTVDRSIGHGGMGTVWLAHRSDGRFEGHAAVKLLNTALVGHPSAQRFAREGNVLARLQHPNIAHLLDAGVAAAGQPYLILEYVRGDRVDRYCETHELSMEQRITLFLDVLAAVAHAHSNLIVHRDIKPSNILVTDDGVVKLLDFGVAALLSPSAESATHLTHHAAPGLTPGYAAPEQLLGESVTTATDVYALGMLLFVLLAGKHPAELEGGSSAELVRLTLDTDAPRPSQITSDVRRGRLLRGDLDNIIAKALRRNPAERYTTVELFALDLRRYLALEPVSARPQSIRYVAAKFARRHRGAVASATAIAITLISAVAVTRLELVEANRQRDQARYQSRRAESGADFLNLLFLSDGGSARPTMSYFDRLNLGVEMLDKQYREDPKFAGRMLVELASYFRDNTATGRAIELYAKAYDLGRRNHDLELMASAQCNRAYAEGYADIREGVMERLGEARRLLEQIPAPDIILQTQCLMAQARFDHRRGESASAEASLRHAMAVLEGSGNTHRQIYIETLNDLGEVYLVRNQPREVLRIQQLIGETDDRNGRGGTSSRLVNRQNAAVALVQMGEVSAALAEREIINKRVPELESFGEEPLAYPVNYAVLLLRMGRSTEALHALDGAVERGRREENPYVLAHVLLTTGSTFIDLGRWDEAEAALKEAVALATNGIGNGNAAAQAESFLARLDLARRRLESARQHGDRSLDLAGYGKEKPERALSRALLVASEVALAEGATADAERFARDALKTSESVARGPDTSADVGESLLRIARARIASGASAGTKSMLERAVRCLSNGLDSNHPLTIEARTLLAGASA